MAKSSDASTWATYAEAARHASKEGMAGVGFVLSESDGLTGIDLDKCRNPETGELDPWAAEIVAFAETYAELSPSRTGLRLFVAGKVDKATKSDPAHVEVYATGRYLTVTGEHLPSTPQEIREAPKTLAAIFARVDAFKAQAQAAREAAQGEKPPQVTLSQRASAAGQIRQALGSEDRGAFFRNVNTEALRNLGSWVPALFGSAAVFQPGTRGYRVSSRAMGRHLEEDLSITPQGAKDFGLHDMGDPRDGSRSPIDLVLETGSAEDATQAAHWLCRQLGRTPDQLGWKAAAAGKNRPPPRRPASPQEVLQEADEIEPGTLSQDALARIFARRFRDRLRYCHSTGAWFEWAGTHWRQDETALAFNFVRELGREMTEGSAPRDVKEVRKVTFAGGVERFARGDRAFAVTSAAWDRNYFLLGTPGGTIDLRTGLVRECDPRDGITKLTAVAPADHADCPQWKAFLDQATRGDTELIRFMQQLAGYALTGDTREHVLAFVYGPGGNGKSVFLNALTGILKDYATTAAMDAFTASRSDKHPTDLAMLRGARLVTASETEEGRSWAEARIKSLTGGDPVTARFMRQDFFTYTPTFKLIIIGNHKPVLNNVDEAARRRFCIIPFMHKPARPDRQLEEKLKAEWPAILRWMIDGCLDWQANGLVRPTSVAAATDAYFADQDVFGQWLDEDCDVEPGNSFKFETSEELFSNWKKYAEAAGEKVGSKKSLVDMLQKRGLNRAKKALGRGVEGIRIVRRSYAGRDGED